MDYELDLEQYAGAARRAAAEGCVLLENKKKALPIKKGEKAAIFGRMAFHYYKSGLGSGGLVNTRKVTGILDALKACEDISLNQKLLQIYEEWILENPYDEGQGWGKVPWSQQEMPVTEEMLKEAEHADISLIVIGRTAGEDQDNRKEEGSYLLTKTEEELIEKVTKVSKRTAVLLNVGNIIDMKWVSKYQPDAVLYVWQGGQEGGNGVVDVLTGKVNACGHLTDTIAQDIEDYPSTAYFGNVKRNIYTEDVYVGYRYFETFAKEKVLYPFGYGLSYTDFQIKAIYDREKEEVCAEIGNVGAVAGKEVVQIYAEVPNGVLGNPSRKLVGFAKTKELKPGEGVTIKIPVSKKDMASYDENGATGNRSCYVLEKGIYRIYVGENVRDAVLVDIYEEKNTIVLEQLEEACAPVIPFFRFHRGLDRKGNLRLTQTPAPMRSVKMRERLEERRPKEIPFTGDRGYLLEDVLHEKITLDQFAAQIADQELIALSYGEGMCSPKVTPGTASAFGGQTKRLKELGVPVGCCADGPSGIRMDCGSKAFSLPNGTLLGCTFDEKLVEELYAFTGKEIRLNRIDSLLGPGMNIHRNPLNGRNFEYISEDPFVTGKIGAAEVRGMAKWGIGCTIKHFCGNNQESGRNTSDSIISERALREIYLRGFEIAVKEGKARSVMTTYGAVNGLWTAGNYDLCTTILRKEWGFEGIVMTDWWAMINYEGKEPSIKNRAQMICAQNDLYMCVKDAASEQDDVENLFKTGYLTRAELQRNAKNILGFLLKSPAMLYQAGEISEEELYAGKQQKEDEISLENLVYYKADKTTGEVVIPGSALRPKKGDSDLAGILFEEDGEYEITLRLRSPLHDLAQLPISVFMDGTHKITVSICGTEGKTVAETRDLGYVFGTNHYMKLHYGANGIEIEEIILKKKLDFAEKN